MKVPKNKSGKKGQSLGMIGSGRIDKIHVKYKNDLNLIELSDRILRFLDLEKTSVIPQLDKDILDLEEKIAKPQFLNARRLDLKALEELQKRKDSILSDERRNKFTKLTEDIVSEYKTLGPLQSKAIFGVEESEVKEDEDKAFQREILISKFLNIARSFVPLDVERRYTPKFVCSGCQYDLKDSIGPSPDDSTEIVCPKCGMIAQIFKQYTYGVIGVENSDYEDRENFIKAKEKFQGKQNVVFPEKFYTDLDSFFTSRGLPTGDIIKTMDKIKGRRGRGIIGKKILRKALANKDYNNHYDDINLIAHNYWQWDLPDISHLDDTLESDYDRTERVFKQIKGAERKATINTQWRLEAHLRSRGYPVEDDDFKKIETPSIVEQYRKWFKIMIERCGDPTLKYIEF